MLLNQFSLTIDFHLSHTNNFHNVQAKIISSIFSQYKIKKLKKQLLCLAKSYILAIVIN